MHSILTPLNSTLRLLTLLNLAKAKTFMCDTPKKREVIYYSPDG